jgi:hypothetical protein
VKNSHLLKATAETKAQLFTPPKDHGFDGYIGYVWDSIFEARPEYRPWHETQSWYIVLEKDEILPCTWQYEQTRYMFGKRGRITVLKNAGHGPFFSHAEEVLRCLNSETGPIKTIRREHEQLIWKRRDPTMSTLIKLRS